jgi:hypothetical protein
MISKLTALAWCHERSQARPSAHTNLQFRSITDLERIVARTTTHEPLGVLAAALADVTRDATLAAD